MKKLNIIFILLITFSFGWAQNQSDHIVKIKNEHKQPNNEKVKSDNQNNSKKEELKEIELIKNSVNIQQTDQKVVPKKVENKASTKTKEKKSFGSAKKSGQEQILEKKPAQDEITDTEAKEKVKKLLNKQVEVKKTD